ncbi:MAG: lipoyl synthase [Deltaproteobacteria bacterium]|nr:lipoyl synthase [Deltaproteobacteria bacterium]
MTDDHPNPDQILPSGGTLRSRLPPWLKVKAPHGPRFFQLRAMARQRNLASVCEEARCPNIGECWQGGTATFMLLGDTCTRGCRFCSVKTRRTPAPPDEAEPQHIADTLGQMALDYVVLTTVDRDDLPDQGAGHMAQTLRRVRLAAPNTLQEILLPDFRGDEDCLAAVLSAGPDVVSHNLETVERLTPRVRDPRAGYDQSLGVLRAVKRLAPKVWTKSSLMLGLGEHPEEVARAMADLREVGCDFLTLGQYLQPDRTKLAVERFVPPEEFSRWEAQGRAMGFAYVAAGPLVRSSYRAAEYFLARLAGTDSPPKAAGETR